MNNPNPRSLDNIFWCNYQPSVADGSTDRYHALLVDRGHVAEIYLVHSTPNNMRCLELIQVALSRWPAAMPSEQELDEDEARRDDEGLPRRPMSDYFRSYSFYGGSHAHIPDAKLDSASTSATTFTSSIGNIASFNQCLDWAGRHRWFLGAGYVVNAELDKLMLSSALTDDNPLAIGDVLLGIDRYVDQSSLSSPPPCVPSFVEKHPNTLYHVLQTNYEGNADDIILIDGRPSNEKVLNKLRKRMIEHAEDDEGWVWQWLTQPKKPVNEAGARRLVANKVADATFNFPRWGILHGQIDEEAAMQQCENQTPFSLDETIMQ